jgi:hypothetical protein
MIEIIVGKRPVGRHDPRREFEQHVARLVSEDHRAMANLSSTPINRTFDEDMFVERLKMYG